MTEDQVLLSDEPVEYDNEWLNIFKKIGKVFFVIAVLAVIFAPIIMGAFTVIAPGIIGAVAVPATIPVWLVVFQSISVIFGNIALAVPGLLGLIISKKSIIGVFEKLGSWIDSKRGNKTRELLKAADEGDKEVRKLISQTQNELRYLNKGLDTASDFKNILSDLKQINCERCAMVLATCYWRSHQQQIEKYRDLSEILDKLKNITKKKENSLSKFELKQVEHIQELLIKSYKTPLDQKRIEKIHEIVSKIDIALADILNKCLVDHHKKETKLTERFKEVLIKIDEEIKNSNKKTLRNHKLREILDKLRKLYRVEVDKEELKEFNIKIVKRISKNGYQQLKDEEAKSITSTPEETSSAAGSSEAIFRTNIAQKDYSSIKPFASSLASNDDELLFFRAVAYGQILELWKKYLDAANETYENTIELLKIVNPAHGDQHKQDASLSENTLDRGSKMLNIERDASSLKRDFTKIYKKIEELANQKYITSFLNKRPAKQEKQFSYKEYSNITLLGKGKSTTGNEYSPETLHSDSETEEQNKNFILLKTQLR